MAGIYSYIAIAILSKYINDIVVGVYTDARSWFGFEPVGQGPIFLDDVFCTGTESALSECSHDPSANHDCGHAEDVAVLCLPNPGKKVIIKIMPIIKVNFTFSCYHYYR